MLQVGTMVMEAAVMTSSSTEMVTAGGRWGNCRMEDIITHYQLSILMTLVNTAIKISILMLSRNDCFDWALTTHYHPDFLFDDVLLDHGGLPHVLPLPVNLKFV